MGWDKRRADMNTPAAAVSAWMIDAIDPQPGQTLLELAAGPGEVGLLAAPRVRPGGHVIITDGAEAMVAAVEARAREVGLSDVVAAKAMEAEWIDLGTAEVDSVLCRWGYMLLVDPEAALRETRRVLKPGGKLAFAVWSGPEDNPWIAASGAAARELGLLPAATPGEPGPFALADRVALRELVETAGFFDVVVDAVDFTFSFADGDAYFDQQRDCSPSLQTALTGVSPADHTRLRDAIDERLAPWLQPDGALLLPARTLVVSAEA